MGTHVLTSSTEPTPTTHSWLLGDELPRRKWLKRMWSAYSLYAALDLLRGLGVIQGLVSADDWMVTLGYDLTWMTLSYALVRSGITANFKDPALTLPQVWGALGSIVLSFALIDVGRTALMPLMCATLVMGLYQLPPRHMYASGGLTLAILGLLTLLMSHLTSDGFQTTAVSLSLLTTAASLPVLAAIASKVRAAQADDAQRRHELQTALAELATLTTQDPLTGLTNHRHMLERLAAECKRHARGGRPFCVAMLDVDHLQEVNDTQGRERGDEVLRQLGLLSKAHLRASDVMGRWGGEEFLLLMPDTDLDGGKRSLDRLREHLFTRWGFYDGGRWSPMNCSAGVTRYRSGEDICQTLARAEDALRAAKTRQHDRAVAA
jgi:diguanylate cyclase (GGDEF)-like protein